jgi:Domain of unknown function (DUF397)
MVDPDPDQAPDPDEGWASATWRKSSRSPDGPPGCLECAVVGGRVGVRDSNDPTGPMLTFGRRTWGEFIAGVKAGEFDW